MKTILLIILTLFSLKAYCYQDFISHYEFQNVKIRLKTGQSFVEIKKKAIILGQLALVTSAHNNYKKTIIFDIDHDYTHRDSSKIYIGFSNIDRYSKNEFPSLHNGEKCLRIYLRIQDVNFEKVIQILQKSINNIGFIASNQSNIQIGNVDISSIESEKLNLINVNSEIIQKILSTKVDRVYDDNQNPVNYTTSYFYKDNKFQLYGLSINNYKNRNDTVVVAAIPNVVQFERLNSNGVIIFDTDSSFYFLNNSYQNGPSISSRHVITKTYNNYMPIEVTAVSDYIMISFYVYTSDEGTQPKYRLLSYNAANDKTIQDLKKVLDEYETTINSRLAPTLKFTLRNKIYF